MAIIALLITGLAICSYASVIKEIDPAPSGKGTPHIKKDQTLAKLTRGKFLVAKRGMKDKRFAQTVILIFEHSEQGAGGLIINRPTSVTVKDAIPKIDAGKMAANNIYIGGPVNPNALFLLIRAPELPQGALHVVDDIYISIKAESLNLAASDGQSAANYRVYAGYSGWAPLQLDKETLHNDWYITDSDTATVFDAKADEIWPALMAVLEH